MAIFELFSKRQKKSQGITTDVYQYEDIPNSFRVQVVHIVRDTIGFDQQYNNFSRNIYDDIHQALCKEFGVFSLDKNANNSFESIFNYFLNANNHIECLDIIDLTFMVISTYVANQEYSYNTVPGKTQKAKDAIDELNYRFKEAGLGYQFENQHLIKINDQYIHSEIVKPTLLVLSSDKSYDGARDEFLKAHEHYRHKRYKECLNECLKSFESTMKAIHVKLKWKYNQGDTAKNLINNCLTNNLIPNYLQNQFSSIRAILESGTPTIRNKESGHGQGAEIKSIPENLASYMLHLTATNILFLANSAENYS